MPLLIDTERPFSEEERQAVVSIQSRFRSYQAQNSLDQIMRGDRNAGSYAVFSAFKTVSALKPVVVDCEDTFGLFATYSSLSKAYPGTLFTNVASVVGTVFGAGGGVDMLLSLLSVIFMFLQCLAVYQAPIVAGMLVRAVFETNEGEQTFEQVALWMGLFVAMAVSMWASAKAMGSVVAKRVTAQLKMRFTMVTAAHSKMIARKEHDSLMRSINEPADAIFVALPAFVGELLLTAASTLFVLIHSFNMGMMLVGFIFLALAVLLVSDWDKIALASYNFETAGLRNQLWCKSNDKDPVTVGKAKVEMIALDQMSMSKQSNSRIWSCVLSCGLLMASLIVGVFSVWHGLHEVYADKIARVDCLYCLLYSGVAVHQLRSALVVTAPALCVQLGGAFKMSSFLSMTAAASVRIDRKAPAEVSYAVEKLQRKVSTPFAPVVMILVVAVASIAAFGKLAETSPLECTPVEVTCKLMDGAMSSFTVAQEFDLTKGCTMPTTESHTELLDLCVSAVPPAVARSQQHTCAVESEKELTAKFTWTTAQGNAAGVTITNPCAHIDLCSNVTCPAADACHTEGQCIAGLCTTPAAADGTECESGVCSNGVCGTSVFVSQSVLHAASTCSANAGVLAVETPDEWLNAMVSERKSTLGRYRRKLSVASRYRKLSTEVSASANKQSSSNCDPRHGACPGYDQMYCNQPFSLNYRETAVYSTHCCSDIGSMSIFFSTTSTQNKVMVKFHKLNGANGEFDFQNGGVNYADPVCRTSEDTNMLTQHDFDTIAPLYDENSLVDVDTKKYDAFGYPFAEKVMSVQFVLDNVLEAQGCTTPQDRRRKLSSDLSDGFAACYLFRGWTTYQCDIELGLALGTTKGLGGDTNAIGAAEAFAAASMLFGKFDFADFGTAAYGSLAAPLTAAAASADFKTAGAAASTADFGAQDYASITMDFGDFQFLSMGVQVEIKDGSSGGGGGVGAFEDHKEPAADFKDPVSVADLIEHVENVVEKCKDNDEWQDEKKYRCHTWERGGSRGDTPCKEQAKKWGYSDQGTHELLRQCPKACEQCGEQLHHAVQNAVHYAVDKAVEKEPAGDGTYFEYYEPYHYEPHYGTYEPYEPKGKKGRRLQVAAKTVAISIPVAASRAVGGFDPLRATQLAKLAAAAPCSASSLEGGKVDLGEAASPRVVQAAAGDAKALVARVADGVVVTLRSSIVAEALADDAELVSLEACAECKVNKALASEWASLRAPLVAALAAQPHKVTVTGHGASAALATLAALDLAEAGVPVAELVTFGEPRVGNPAFAAYYEDSAVYPHFRVTHGRDPVVHAPSAAAGFAHVGREVFFNKASSSYTMCGRGEDPACSLSVVLATGLDDHLSYMGENFAAKYLECAVAPAEASSSAESAMMAKAAKELA